MSKLYVVLPAYNEEANIGKLLNRMVYQLELASVKNYNIVVVNDGSADNTYSIVEKMAIDMPITLLNHEVNQGLGPTIRDGLKYASEVAEDNDIIVSMDADDTHTPGLIYRMMRSIREGHDVVIASRYQSGSRVIGLTFMRKLYSYIASWIFRALLPIKGVKDFTCGYRAYRASVLKRAFKHYGTSFIDQKGFQAMVDIILKIRRFDDVIFGEVPFILRYDLKEGLSKMNVNSTILNTLKLIVKRKFEK
ncbi:MAG: glycosyltransferase [Flavobacteriales bacterium]|jgi:dolichol-phosphate mannosyltransferase|nr:glycosyltransferase [Flavobacteriales bacterium]